MMHHSSNQCSFHVISSLLVHAVLTDLSNTTSPSSRSGKNGACPPFPFQARESLIAPLTMTTFTAITTALGSLPLPLYRPLASFLCTESECFANWAPRRYCWDYGVDVKGLTDLSYVDIVPRKWYATMLIDSAPLGLTKYKLVDDVEWCVHCYWEGNATNALDWSCWQK